jgi:asparagine synthetase B (glutamine-hydrolysing)
LAGPAFIALHLLAEFARRLVTAAVGGDGADELFGGHPRYRWLQLANRIDAVPAPALRAGAASPAGPRPVGAPSDSAGCWTHSGSAAATSTS